jgi:hypothetical protein
MSFLISLGITASAQPIREGSRHAWPWCHENADAWARLADQSRDRQEKDVPDFPYTVTSFLRVQTFYVAYLEKLQKLRSLACQSASSSLAAWRAQTRPR